MTSTDQWEAALGALRVLHYLGFVLAAGVVAFWALVGPTTVVDRRLVRLVAVGIVVSALTTLGLPLLRWSAADTPLTEAVSRESGAAAMAHLAVLAFLAGFLGDLVASPLSRARRWVAGSAVLALSVTMAVQSTAVARTGTPVTCAMLALHLVAVAVWVGGLLALAVKVAPGQRSPEFDDLTVRFLPVSYACLATLVGTGIAHALLAAGGPGELTGTRYALVLLVKGGLVAAMLVVGNGARTYALDVAFGQRVSPAPVAQKSAIHTFALVLGIEVATAFVVLVATSVLVYSSGWL